MIKTTRRVAILCISFCCWMLQCCCAAARRLLGKEVAPKAVVLCYHEVGADQLDAFRWQMDELRRSASIVRAGERGGLSGAGLHVAITFDDAFVSTLQNAVPELVSRDMPCTIFAPTGWLGCQPSWFCDASFRGADEVVATAEQLRALPPELVTIGSHTSTHRNLCLLSNETVRKEFAESRAQLEQILGREVSLLAFPYGRFCPAHIDAAMDAGYSRVFTVVQRFVTLDADESVCGRVHVSPTDWHCEFRLKIRGAFCWSPRVCKVRKDVGAFLRTARNRRMKRNVDGVCERDVSANDSAVSSAESRFGS